MQCNVLHNVGLVDRRGKIGGTDHAAAAAAGLGKEHGNLSYFGFIQCANVKVKREKLPKLMAVKGRRGMLPTYSTAAAA